MGQGYSLTTLSAGSAGIEVPELADLTYDKNLQAARFMKTIRARHQDGLVVAKVVMKPYQDLKLDRYVRRLLEERKALTEVPNALAYHRILETSGNGYLVRQYIHSSLYDKMSTRPFLEDIERRWLAFQLLCAVRDSHARNIYHGDIKTENVLVTSWNWLYLADYSSSFKPAYLPEDNPSDFAFYFDTSGRRTCYLAPERFLPAGTHPEGEEEITWAMDIFSVGCVIAELFLETSIFTLSQMFKYRQNEYDPTHAHISNIPDENIREMVSHMIQLDPNSRYVADEYLNFWKGKAFPPYFYGFLQQYMHSVTDPSSGRAPVTSQNESLGEADDRIEKVYNDFDKISILLAGGESVEPSKPQRMIQKPNIRLFPLCVDIPNYQHQASSTPELSPDAGDLLFLDVVVSSLRGTARAAARIRGCELLLAFAERVTDEAKLDRIVPFLTILLADQSDLVKVAALRTLTQILALVSAVPPLNAYVFPEYILPKLLAFSPTSKEKPSPLLRMTYASCMGFLANIAARFLDVIQAMRTNGSMRNDPEAEDDPLSASSYRTLFDRDRQQLLSDFEAQTKALLTDTEPSVRRAMLGSVSDLCVFFGSPKANDVVLSHLNTYLNDRDWMLKCAFFETIVGVAVFVGGSSLEEFILPLMVQALTDPEEFVVEKVLRAFSSIAELGLFQRSKTWELVDVVGRFTMHPNIWIREAAAQFISAASKFLSIADTHSILANLIKPYLKVLPSDFSELRLLDSLKKPLPRIALDLASTWALTSEKGLFWVPAKQQRTFSFGSTEDTLPTVSGKDLNSKALRNLRKNEEDDSWLTRLRSSGMSAEDEFKLVALREYIWRVAHRRKKNDSGSSPEQFNRIMALKDLDIIPQTVLFENSQKVFEKAQGQYQEQNQSAERDTDHPPRPRTIADALLDASTTEDDAISRRRILHADTHADRLVREESGIRRDSSPTSPTLPSSPTDLRSGQDSPISDTEVRRGSLKVPTSAPRSLGSPTGQSPAGSVGAASPSEHGHGLRHKGSAISLLNKGDNKAIAETGTTSTNAFGKVDVTQRDGLRPDRQISQLAVAQERHQRSPSRIRYKEAHNYRGNDPTVLKLLDSLYLENYQVDEVEFGTQIQLNSKRQIKRRDGTSTSPTSSWKPEGVLVCSLTEHKAAVTRVLVAPDQAFFITGSDDGTVKVWDTSRLERNVTRRSRQTFTLAQDARVTSLAFVENTYSFVCTGSDGSVTVVRVEYYSSHGQAKFGKLKILREHQLSEGDHAVWSEHYKGDSQSVLILATNTSKIIALELRTMIELFTLHNPVHHGTPTCFCIDRRHHWLLLGTSHGVLDLWDLRFQLRLKSWGFHGSSPIHRLILSPLKSRKSRIYVAGGTGQGEVTVWDIDKTVCKEVYRAGTSRETGSKSTTLIDLDEENAGGMLGRFATSLESTANASADRGIRAMVVESQPGDEGTESKQLFIVTAGPDWKVRYWDTLRYENCTVVCGIDTEEESKPTYRIDQPSPDTIVVSEKLHSQIQQSSLSSGRDGRAASNTSAKRGSNKPSRSTLISSQAQRLMNSHLDTIMDVAFLEAPFGMTISVDRAGVILLFM